MFLKSVRVQNYKCVNDSEIFSISPMTCLVGKNESGKTALLQALYKLNPVVSEDATFCYLEYPRNRWDGKDEQSDNVLTTVWALSDDDHIALLPILGPSADSVGEVTVTKGYTNRLQWQVIVDEPAVVQHHLQAAELFSEEREALAGQTTISGVISYIKNLSEPSPHLTGLLEGIQGMIPDGDLVAAVEAVLEERLPKCVYFSDYYTLPGKVSVDGIAAKSANRSLEEPDRVFLALLNLAGIELADLQNVSTQETLIARLEAVQNRITREIFSYWSQNSHLKVVFRCDPGRSGDTPPFNKGWVFQTRIENRRHGSTVNFDERSHGFVWFFSFLVWFSQVRKNYGDNLLILLDEPGLSLHARAQADLLRYMREKLCPASQVLYTTHSPFMIDPEDLLSARTVEDVTVGDDIRGTKVGDKSLSTDADTVFPLQAALGYDITQTLFVGKHTLLVEGPSDLLYLKWLSRELLEQGRTHLSPEWVISPCGGISKVNSFLALFGRHFHVAVLTDYHEPEKRQVKGIRESALLKDGHVLTADTYVDQTEADTEDLLGREAYITLVNECYHLSGNDALPAQKPVDAPTRVVKEVEHHFAVLPPTIQEFDHFLPATYAMENSLQLRGKLPGFDTAMDRFERLFMDLNRLLLA